MKITLVFSFLANPKSPLNITMLGMYEMHLSLPQAWIVWTHVLFSFTSFLIKSERCKQYGWSLEEEEEEGLGNGGGVR